MKSNFPNLFWFFDGFDSVTIVNRRGKIEMKSSFWFIFEWVFINVKPFKSESLSKVIGKISKLVFIKSASLKIREDGRIYASRIRWYSKRNYFNFFVIRKKLHYYFQIIIFWVPLEICQYQGNFKLIYVTYLLVI